MARQNPDPIARLIDREARATMRALQQGKRLKPIVITIDPVSKVRAMMAQIEAASLSSTNFPMYDIPGARSLRSPRDAHTVTAACAHRDPLKLLTDNLAVCWQCGEQFDVVRL